MIFSIVIPLFNEELNIDKLVEEIFLNLSSDYKFELILINDSSTDNTEKILNKLIKKFSNKIILIKNKKNLGQSFSIIKGIKSSNYNTIVTLDGDGQNNPKDIKKLVDLYFSDEQIFLVGGLRIKRKDSNLKIISSFIANKIRNLILKDDCKDTGCALKVFDKTIFLSFPMFNGIHRFLPALFKGSGKKTLFVPVDHRHRIYGKSKYGTLERLIKGIVDIIRVLNIINNYKINND